MSTDSLISTLVAKLIEALRRELHEYGEMLALLDQQQDYVVRRAADDVLQSVSAVNEQMVRIRTARQERDSCQQATAAAVRKTDDPSFANLIPALPDKYRFAVDSLVRENNELLERVQHRARQNHLLLTRSLHLMQQLLNALIPASQPTTYSGEGTLQAGTQPGQMLYEAVG